MANQTLLIFNKIIELMNHIEIEWGKGSGKIIFA